MNRFAQQRVVPYNGRRKASPLPIASTRQDKPCRAASSLPRTSRKSATSPPSGARSSPATPTATKDPAPTSISRPWRTSPPPRPRAFPPEPWPSSSNSKPMPWGPNHPAPTAAGPAACVTPTAPWTIAAANWLNASRSATVPTAAGTFSPQRPLLRLDAHGYSPAVLQMIVKAGGRLSFADAAFALGLAGVAISPRHIQHLTELIGGELAAAGAAQAVAHRRRQLDPQGDPPPPHVVAAAEVDGGKLRTRAPGCGPGVHQAQYQEAKIACLLSL